MPQGSAEKSVSRRYEHILCRSAFWAICAVLGCAYLAWLSFSKIRSLQLGWPTDLWSVLAYLIWIVFMLIILADVHCRRERFFFSIVLGNFVLGIFMTAWTNASPAIIRATRYLSLAIWIFGIAVAAWILVTPHQKSAALHANHERHA